MNLASFKKLIKFREEVSFFKRKQLEKILQQISETLDLSVVGEFLDSCWNNFRNLPLSWIQYLDIMLTKHISKNQKSLQSNFIFFSFLFFNQIILFIIL